MNLACLIVEKAILSKTSSFSIQALTENSVRVFRFNSMKINLLLILAISINIACSNKNVSNANAVNNAGITQNSSTPSNIAPVANLSNNNLATNSASNSPKQEADTEVLKKIQEQQKETTDIRKAGNSNKPIGKPPAGAPKSY